MKILIAENEPWFLKSIQDYLENAGFNCESVSQLSKAFSKSRENNSEQVALLICLVFQSKPSAYYITSLTRSKLGKGEKHPPQGGFFLTLYTRISYL